MSNVVDRITLACYRSVNTPDFPPSRFVINPLNFAEIEAAPGKYRKISGDILSVMSLAERDVIDAAEESAQLDSVADELVQTRTIMRAFAEVVLDEINNLRGQHGLNPRTLAQLKIAVRSKL